MDEWKAEIDKMKAKADKAEANAQLEYNKQIEDLRSKQEVAQEKEKLGEFRDVGEDALEDLKAGTELAWDSLGEAVKSATSRFNQTLV